MECPRCDRPTRVLESRRADDGTAVRRRRECSGCGERFTTYERREREPLFVRKRGGDRQRFDRTKLRAALLGASHKRPVSPGDIEHLVDRIEDQIRRAGGELGSQGIEDLSLDGLSALDDGAYLQFLGTLPQSRRTQARKSVRSNRKSAKLPPQTKLQGAGRLEQRR